MIYVLIVLGWIAIPDATDKYPILTMQEFSKKETCEGAAKQIQLVFPSVGILCVPK